MSVSFFNTTSATVWLGDFFTNVAGLKLDYATVKVNLGLHSTDSAGNPFPIDKINASRNSYIDVNHNSVVYLDSGGGRTGASYNWTHVGAGAVLTTHYTLNQGGSSIVYGEGLLENKDTTIQNYTYIITTPVAGQGHFDLNGGAKMEFTGYVGADQTVNIKSGGAHLQIDDARQFLGDIVVEAAASDADIKLRGVDGWYADFVGVGNHGVLRILDVNRHVTAAEEITWRPNGGVVALRESDGSVKVQATSASRDPSAHWVGTFLA